MMHCRYICTVNVLDCSILSPLTRLKSFKLINSKEGRLGGFARHYKQQHPIAPHLIKPKLICSTSNTFPIPHPPSHALHTTHCTSLSTYQPGLLHRDEPFLLNWSVLLNRQCQTPSSTSTSTTKPTSHPFTTHTLLLVCPTTILFVDITFPSHHTSSPRPIFSQRTVL